MSSPSPASPPPSTHHVPSPSPTMKTSLESTKTNLKYWINGPQAGNRPKSLTIRAGLRTTRYVIKFVFWRLIRYFKYTLIAAGTAALAGTAIGAVVPVAGALLVPSIPVAAVMGLGTAVFKFGWRHRGNHFRQGWLVGGEGRDAREDEKRDAEQDKAEPVKVHPRASKAWDNEQF